MYSFREGREEDDTRPWGNAFEVDPSLAVIDESFLNHEILIMRVTFASLIFLFPRSFVSTANINCNSDNIVIKRDIP